MYTSHALTTGFVLQGDKYKISKVLGNGGFGITYLAKHNFLEKEVAIKEVYSPTFCKRNNDGSLTGLSDNFEVFKRNFFSEARTLAKFSNNKNIVQVSDIFNENNTIYFVMDYVEGYSLQEFIDKKGILPFSQAIKYTIDILTALIEVHQNNILHRDIKPANLLIRNTDKEIILIDFGIAREFTQDETLTQTTMASVGYAPPEQSVSSHKRTASMDLYSVGAVLYFCLTGKRPQSNNELSVQAPISAKQLNSAIPKNLDDLITKAIQQRPPDRFQSAEEMIKSLSELNVLPVPAKSNYDNISLLSADELYNKGNNYYNGNRVEKNYQEAIKWYIKAAEQNHIIAQYTLGKIYYEGERVEKNHPEALKWYKKASKQGHSESQSLLATMYSSGKGTKKDYHEAIKWYLKAVEKDKNEYIGDLSLCYKEIREYKEAIKWLKIEAKEADNIFQKFIIYMLIFIYYLEWLVD